MSIPKMAAGSTRPRYRTTSGGCCSLLEKIRNGKNRVSMVAAVHTAMVSPI